MSVSFVVRTTSASLPIFLWAPFSGPYPDGLGMGEQPFLPGKPHDVRRIARKCPELI